jgi:helicase SWR1
VRKAIDESAPDDQQDEASKAMDRVLDNRGGGGLAATNTRVFEQVEDKEDIDAAKNAQKEMEHADDGDFEEAGTTAQIMSGAGTAGVVDGEKAGETEETAEEGQPEPNHIDDYLVRFMEWNVRDEPLVLPPDKARKKSKRGKEHRVRRR